MTAENLKRTPLLEVHQSLNARMVPFEGWEMPVQYSGIVEEHRAVRSAAGLFDVSHMGEFEISGPGAKDFLQFLTTNDLEKLRVGRCQYSFLLNSEGGTVDDTMIYRRADNTYLLVVNASNIEKDWAHVSNVATNFAQFELVNRSEDYALLALQGPRAENILNPLTDLDLGSLRFHQIAETTISDHSVLLAASGYTGENGFEIFTSPESVSTVWNTLLDKGTSRNLKPCGLGARDTLRLEASLALYGHELDDETSPLEASLGFAVARNGTYLGSDVMQKQRTEGLSKTIVMLEMKDRGIPRQGYEIQSPGGEVVGKITSGSIAPWLDKSIAMGYVPPALSDIGQTLHISVRNRILQAEVVSRPFYKRPDR